MSIRCDDNFIYLGEGECNLGHFVEPLTYSEAPNCPHSSKWIEAMDDEIKFMDKHNVYVEVSSIT